MESRICLATGLVIVSALVSQFAFAATYRLELTSGRSVLATRDFEFSAKSKPVGYQHPHVESSKMNGMSIEIGDKVSACGTFLRIKEKRDLDQPPVDAISAMVTLVEKSSIATGKMNAKTEGTDQLEKKAQTLAVQNTGLARTCTLRVL